MSTTQSTMDFFSTTESVDTALQRMLSVSAPPRTKSYTPISHKTVIERTAYILNKMNFETKKTIYRSSTDGLIAQAEYHINYGNDPEMGLMIAWQNSYNKQVSFKYAVGAHVFICANGMVSGDLGAYKRRHTGEADVEALGSIENYLSCAKGIFDQLVKDRDELKKVQYNKKDIAELMGRMYVEKEIITSTQLNIMKRELEKPTYDYGVDPMNAWAVYNYATHAFKEDTPKNWITRHKDLHNFFMNKETEFKFSPEEPKKQPQVFSMQQDVIQTDTSLITNDILDMF